MIGLCFRWRIAARFVVPSLVSLRIEDLDVAHRLISVRAETTKGRRSRVVCYSPDIAPILGMHLHVLRLAGKSIEGIDPVWVSGCRRWRDTSTLRPRTRESNYSFMLRTGIWLTREQLWVNSPVDWNTSTCAALIAEIDQMTVGEWALESALGTKLKGLGQPMHRTQSERFCMPYAAFSSTLNCGAGDV